MSKGNREFKIEEFKQWLCHMQMSRNTVIAYVRAVRQLVEYLDGKEPDVETMARYKETLLEKYRPASANLYLMACRKFLIFCGCEKDSLPRPVRVQAGQSVENILTFQEYEKMLHYAMKNGRQKDYLIMRTLACTGIRVSELSYITVESLSAGKTQVYNKRKYREIFFPDKLVAELSDYCQKNHLACGSIFLGSRGTSIDRRSVWEMLQKMAQCCGVEKDKAHPHGFRHLFAKIYMGQYANLPELADILGHSSIETTRRYTMSSVEEKRRKMENLPL